MKSRQAAVVFVFVLGVYAAIGFGLIASVTAVSYPIELFFRHKGD